MRDAHRMREKYDLSLDSRQVVSLLIGGIVVLGAVFVLGVLVGKKLAGTPRADRAPDLLTALDHRSDALERARAAPPLTFQEELTRPTPTAPTVARAAAPSAPAAAPSTSARPAPATAAPAAPTATTAAGKSPPSTVAAVEPKPQGEKKAEPEKKTEPERKADARPTRTESVATRTAPAAAHPAPKVPEATSATGAFTLQLGASPSRDDAERQASRLREKGYAPYIVAAEVPGKGTWYRVRMGSFPTKDAATRYLQDFKRETQAEAFVASTR
jgi:cell division septation protein DedD